MLANKCEDKDRFEILLTKKKKEFPAASPERLRAEAYREINKSKMKVWEDPEFTTMPKINKVKTQK